MAQAFSYLIIIAGNKKSRDCIEIHAFGNCICKKVIKKAEWCRSSYDEIRQAYSRLGVVKVALTKRKVKLTKRNIYIAITAIKLDMKTNSTLCRETCRIHK
jgi:hypothetical protein